VHGVYTVQRPFGARQPGPAANPEEPAGCSQRGGGILSGERNTGEDIRSQFRKYISTNFVVPGGEAALTKDASLLEEGIMDSTGVLDLVMFIEETFGIQVKDEELIPENLDSVDRLVAFVEKKTARAS
jgi:acyl carrier protein